MRKYLPFALAVLVVLAGSTLIAGAATPPEKVTIDDCVAKKAAVEFPHGAHVKAIAECKTCHHTQPALTATSGEKVETCGSCHVTPEKAETPKCSEMSATKNPFHMACVACHKEELAKKPDTKAPTKCDQCHPKA
jgi:hypothetical protein